MDARDINGKIARIGPSKGWRSVAGAIISGSGSALRAAGLVASIDEPRQTETGTVAEIGFFDDEGRSSVLRLVLVLADATTSGADAEDGILFGGVFLDSQRTMPLARGWTAVTDKTPAALGIFVDDLSHMIVVTLCDALATYGSHRTASSSFEDRVVRHDLATPVAEALLEAMPDAEIAGFVSPEGVGFVFACDEESSFVLTLHEDAVAWMDRGVVVRRMALFTPWGMSLHERMELLVEEILDRSGLRPGNVRTI
jgi:hypothetical protein